jgi:enediyne biosynthesis protein E4
MKRGALASALATCASVLALCFALASAAGEASVQGRVLGRDARPVSGAVVALTPATGSARKAILTLTAGDGAYSFTGLEPGTEYELKADSETLSSLGIQVRAPMAGVNLTVAPSIEFEDVASRAGLNFTLRNGATGRFYQPEIMLGGVAAFDYNNDGCTDIFFSNGAELPSSRKTGPEFHNRLYRNNCDMTFTDVTDAAGLAGEGYSMGVAAADYDNDGYADILVTGLNGETLYHNRGNGTFEDVTSKAGLPGAGPNRWSVSAGWFDYDNDGCLDLFVTSYVEWKPGDDNCWSEGGKPFYCHPRVYKPLPNRLYHNNRNGAFTDVSRISGIAGHPGKGMGVAFGDYNNDGLMDVFVANDSVPNSLFENLGNGVFREIGLQTGVAYAFHGNAVAGMGADFRDFDDDGRDDIVLDAMYFDEFPLFRNLGPPRFFSDVTVSSGLALATRNLTGWGLGMYDFDNDGSKDLFFATSHFPGSEPTVHADAPLPNHVLRNRGSGRFEDISVTAGRDFQLPGLYHGAAFADFDNDGRVDALVTAVNSPARLFRNVSQRSAHWIALRLEGTASNRDGIGARIRIVLPNGETHYNRAGTSVGYASSSEPLVRFGLGTYAVAREIEIQWPGGRSQVLAEIKGDRIVTLREPPR